VSEPAGENHFSGVDPVKELTGINIAGLVAYRRTARYIVPAVSCGFSDFLA